MAFIKADYSSLRKLSTRLVQARMGFQQTLRKSMLQATILVQGFIKQQILNPGGGFGPLVAGKANNLLSSWATWVSQDGMTGVVSTTKIYSSVMEEGRRAGSKMPPREAIERWLQDKRILDRVVAEKVAKLKTASKGKRIKGGIKKKALDIRERTLHSLAFVIARSIGRRGIKGRRYVKTALAKAQPKLDQIFSAVPGVVIERLSA